MNKSLSLSNYFYSVHGIWFLGDLAINSIIVALLLIPCTGNLKHDWKCFLLGMPFTIIPKLGYSALGLFMYLFFVLGFCFKAYYHGDFNSLLKYWKQVLFIYFVCLLLYNIMPYEPASFILWGQVQKVLVIDCLKTILSCSGSYLMLFFVYKMLPILRGS